MIHSPWQYKLAKLKSLIIAGTTTLFVFLLNLFFFQINILINLLIMTLLSIFTYITSYLFLSTRNKKRTEVLSMPFKNEWQNILQKHVNFYTELNSSQKKLFEKKIKMFLAEKKIIGINTRVDDKCKVLVASSAIIPVFLLPDWEYTNFNEILIYPSNFDNSFNFANNDSDTVGIIDNKTSTLLISKPALYYGFQTNNEKQSISIHEFVHKVDNEDTNIDGIPALIIDKHIVKNWLEVIKEESEKIKNGYSDISKNALINNAEFFYITSQYYFNYPQKMAKLHPSLYKILKTIFKQNFFTILKMSLKEIFSLKTKLKKSSLCPCGSKRRYKDCCYKNIF